MQSVDPNAGAARAARGPLSPIVAFVVLLGLLALIGSIIFLTRPDAPPPTAPLTRTEGEPSFALTDEEAIARFEELNEMRMSAYATRDRTLLRLTYTDDSKVKETVEREISTLIDKGVLDKSVEATLKLHVLSNSSAEIRIREVARVIPHFVSQRGRDVTSDPKPVIETRIWTLKEQGGVWLVYDAFIATARKADA